MVILKEYLLHVGIFVGWNDLYDKPLLFVVHMGYVNPLHYNLTQKQKKIKKEIIQLKSYHTKKNPQAYLQSSIIENP